MHSLYVEEIFVPKTINGFFPALYDEGNSTMHYLNVKIYFLQIIASAHSYKLSLMYVYMQINVDANFF